MNFLRLFLSLFSISFFLSNCVPPSDEKVVDIRIDLTDPTTQRLLEFQDKHLTDSLVRYFLNPNATYRFLAARAFGSTKDSVALDGLSKLLRDESEDVRMAAAFSIGQIGARRGERFLLDGFDKKDSLLVHRRSNGQILEAIGRCGGLESLKNIAAVSTYLPTDTSLLEGQSLAIFRFLLRKMTSTEATAKMVGFVADEKWPESVRVVGANFLRRGKMVSLDSTQINTLVAVFQKEKNPEIRMGIAPALGRSVGKTTFALLSSALKTESDYRVKVMIINALAKFDGDTTRTLVAEAVRDKNQAVASTAAQFFVQNGRQVDADWYWRLGRDSTLDWQTRVLLFQASNRFLGSKRPESRDYINFWLKNQFERSSNPYEKAACLTALGEFGWNLRYLRERGFTANHAAIKVAAVVALDSIAQRRDYYQFFGDGGFGVRKELNIYFHDAIQSGDAGMIAAAADALRNDRLHNFKNMADSSQRAGMDAALARLRLPQEIETYNSLARTIDFFNGQPERADRRTEWNHPIDWAALAGLGAHPKATISTKKGVIKLELLPEMAVGSVVNFIKLAKQGFFNGKTFHRVVPNFVIQGGCSRGDGFGALDFTIRSELSLLRYDREGWVGMASSGRDTEGTQWFITHSPMPHLDGNYTIFARVVEGMEVVHQIEIGDVMNTVSISND